jgi:hypothetical protein
MMMRMITRLLQKKSRLNRPNPRNSETPKSNQMNLKKKRQKKRRKKNILSKNKRVVNSSNQISKQLKMMTHSSLS